MRDPATSERKGQRGGDIDVGIAILDGIGLLFFIIPGVIAYAVDFSNGTIYLPHRSRPASGEADELRRIHFDPHRSTCADIEAILERETGRTIKLDEPTVQVLELGSVDEMKAWFAANDGARLAAGVPLRAVLPLGLAASDEREQAEVHARHRGEVKHQTELSVFEQLRVGHGLHLVIG